MQATNPDLILVNPAHSTRRIALSIDGRSGRGYSEDDLGTAKKAARTLRDSGMAVTLRWETESHEASYISPAQYAIWLEDLQQDEADIEREAEFLERFGRVSESRIDADLEARKAAGLSEYEAWPGTVSATGWEA